MGATMDRSCGRSITAAAVMAAIVTLFAPTSSRAQSDYPNRVVKIVNPFGAGSAPDILVRALSTGLASGLGQQFIVENRVGGSGAVGTASVVRADADGYTLLFAPALVLSVLPQARGGSDPGYKPDSLVPVCQTFVNTMGLVVRPDSPIKSVADLIAAAKQRPGQLNYGHPGVLTIPQLAMEELQQTAGVEIKDIPFRSGPQSMTELLGGRLDVVSIVMGTEVGQNIRVIGVFSEKRIATFPDVPTIKEQGYDVTPASFGGLLAPLGTPPAVVAKLSQACATAAKDDVYVTTAKRAGQPEDYYADAEAFRQRLARDIESKTRVLARIKTQ
jgi:tripartite-type tricarboxylate transporter receptor subunit TctC